MKLRRVGTGGEEAVLDMRVSNQHEMHARRQAHDLRLATDNVSGAGRKCAESGHQPSALAKQSERARLVT